MHLLHQCLHYQAHEVNTEISSRQSGSHLLELLAAFHRTSVHVQGPGSLRSQDSGAFWQSDVQWDTGTFLVACLHSISQGDQSKQAAKQNSVLISIPEKLRKLMYKKLLLLLHTHIRTAARLPHTAKFDARGASRYGCVPHCCTHIIVIVALHFARTLQHFTASSSAPNI